MGEIRNGHKCFSYINKKKAYLEDEDINGEIILRRFLRKQKMC
jgi:hypothetical protein